MSISNLLPMSNSFLCCGLALCFLACQSAESLPQSDRASQVDPFIGTAAHGHTYPGATVPFGAVQLSPDNGTPGWDWCSGYNYVDSIIVGFSHTHLSGTGIGDLADILFMPTRVREIDFSKQIKDRFDYAYHSGFSHAEEQASPGYYRVRLADPDVLVELTASTHTGIHRYTFPPDDSASVVIDLGYLNNWDLPYHSEIQVLSEQLITGSRFSTGWAKDQRVFFAAEFSRPFSATSPYRDSIDLKREILGKPGFQAKAGIQLYFDTETESEVLVKVGISSASVEGALTALETVADQSFEDLRQQAANAWAGALGAIELSGGDPVDQRIFYTALYHAQLAPVQYSDAQGEYKGVDGKRKQADGYTRYDILSLWDIFRAETPLLALLRPDLTADLIPSMMAHYEEYGLLPVWALLGNETNTMTGYHAIPVIAEAQRKGIPFDGMTALNAMLKSAMQDIRASDHYRNYQYIPYDSAGQSVTRTLEYCYDDWCIAQMAKAVGEIAIYETFMERASWYRNVFDAETGFMRAKMADGSWKAPFDPQYSSHDFAVAEYTEGNAWQHSWFVPHDVQGLIDLHGGQEAFLTKLDELFETSSEIKGDFVSADISGLIGQYAHGNEPSHHIAYLYNYAGAPWKTQARVREILKTQYTDQPDGLCGNEDCGQMSAWYVFSAMGLYPVNPAEGNYVIGSPLFESADIKLPNGNTFTIEAPGVSDANFYVQSALLNGQPLIRSYLTHEEITAGGTLRLEMGPSPNKTLWADPESYPPSM